MLMKKKTPNLPEEEQKCQKTVQMWCWEVVGEYLITLNVSFLPFKLQKWDFFTGLGCSCFRQIYCSPLLEDLSGFPVEKSKERKTNLQGKIRLQWVFHVPKLLLLKEFSWLDLVPEFGFQSQGSHVGLGCCREQEKKNKTGIVWGALGLELLLGHSWARPASCRGSQSNFFVSPRNSSTSHPLVPGGNPPIW